MWASATTRRCAATAATLVALSSAHQGIAQAAAAHDRFVGVVLAGGGVDDIAAVLGELLSCWVVVLDADGGRLAARGAAPDGVAAQQGGEAEFQGVTEEEGRQALLNEGLALQIGDGDDHGVDGAARHRITQGVDRQHLSGHRAPLSGEGLLTIPSNLN